MIITYYIYLRNNRVTMKINNTIFKCVKFALYDDYLVPRAIMGLFFGSILGIVLSFEYISIVTTSVLSLVAFNLPCIICRCAVECIIGNLEYNKDTRKSKGT
jgi:hypothetical protein